MESFSPEMREILGRFTLMREEDIEEEIFHWSTPFRSIEIVCEEGIAIWWETFETCEAPKAGSNFAVLKFIVNAIRNPISFKIHTHSPPFSWKFSILLKMECLKEPEEWKNAEY